MHLQYKFCISPFFLFPSLFPAAFFYWVFFGQFWTKSAQKIIYKNFTYWFINFNILSWFLINNILWRCADSKSFFQWTRNTHTKPEKKRNKKGKKERKKETGDSWEPIYYLFQEMTGKKYSVQLVRKWIAIRSLARYCRIPITLTRCDTKFGKSKKGKVKKGKRKRRKNGKWKKGKKGKWTMWEKGKIKQNVKRGK